VTAPANHAPANHAPADHAPADDAIVDVESPAGELIPPASAGGRIRRWMGSLVTAVGPILLGLTAGGILLLFTGRNPFTFYGDLLGRGLFSTNGVQDSLTRIAPLLLIGAGLIVAFRANIWNVGGDGQFLMAAALVAGFGPAVTEALPGGLGLVLLCLIGATMGALWTIVPAVLKAFYGLNEVITTLMMTFIGVNLANLLIKGPFRSTTTNVPQTDVTPKAHMLPYIPGTHVHVGIIIALIAILAVDYVLTRTAFGLRLSVLGASPRAAVHAGIDVRRLTIVTFLVSGAFIGLAAAIEILGVWGYVRADWNPNFGLTLFALVFLARLNPLACIPLVGFYAVVSTGGHYAARRAGLPDDFMLMVVGLILLFMALTEFVAARRARRPRRFDPRRLGPGQTAQVAGSAVTGGEA
jgi:simple sugar transport system permease protein